MGHSGSGKSTLMHIMGFLDRPDGGSYKIGGTEVSGLSDDELALMRNNLVGFVFQQFHLLRRVNVLENTGLPLIYAGDKNVKTKAYKQVEAVGLANREKHRPSELSGGEQQRVAIARALVNNPKILLCDEPTGNLDTKSEEEIMRIFKGLHEQGKTIILVTHERDIAEYANRIITLRDGEIISDEKKLNRQDNSGDDFDLSVEKIISHRCSTFGRIEFIEHIRQSFRAVFANKVRSFLSILGILFGVAAVIAMLALGQGAKEAIEENLKTLGSNLLYIRGGSSHFRGVAAGSGAVTRFTFGDIEEINNLKPLIKKASGIVRGNAQIVYTNENWNTSIEGVGYDYGQMRATMPDIGRWFTQDEILYREKVVVLGLTVVKKLFGNSNPLGKTVKLNRINFRVIGIAPEKGSGGHRDQDDVAYIPVTTAMYRVLGKDYLDGLYVEVSDAESVADVQERIRAIITERHKLYKTDENSFEIRDMNEIQEMLSSTTRTMSMLLGCIAAISLLVGGYRDYEYYAGLSY